MSLVYVLIARSHFRDPVRGIFTQMAIGVALGVYSVAAIWRHDANQTVFEPEFFEYFVSTGFAPVIALIGVLLIFVATLRIQKRAIAEHHQRSIRLLYYGLIAAVLTSIMVLVSAFIFVSPLMIFVRASLGAITFFFFAIGAYRFRHIEVGGAIQLLLFVGFFLIASVMNYSGVLVNERMKEDILETNKTFVQDFVTVQIQEHISAAGLAAAGEAHDSEMNAFLTSVTSENTQRVKVISKDGSIIASDLKRLVGGDASLSDRQKQVLEGEMLLILEEDNSTFAESEAVLDGALVAFVPLDLKDGFGTRGVVEIYYDSATVTRGFAEAQNDVVQAMLLIGALVLVVFAAIFYQLQRHIVAPLTDLYEQLTRVHKAESEYDPVLGNRRIHITRNQTFYRIAEKYNHFIELHEKQVKKFKKTISKNS